MLFQFSTHIWTGFTKQQLTGKSEKASEAWENSYQFPLAEYV